MHRQEPLNGTDRGDVTECVRLEAHPEKRTILVTLVLLGSSCAPTAPSTVTDGIMVFADTNYSGVFQQFTTETADLEDHDGGCSHDVSPYSYDFHWGDCISSIKVAPGWIATIYKDDHYKGQSLTITSNTPDLKKVSGPCGDDWNDCISSIRLSRQ